MNYITPNVLKRKNQGMEMYHLRDIEFANRVIVVDSNFDYQMCISLASQLRYLEQENSEEEIIMRITSPGGIINAGLIVADTMNKCKAPITTVALGNVASMGSLIFSLGDKRLIYPSTTIMIHDPIVAGDIQGSALEIANISKELMKTREAMAQILAKQCNKTIEEIYAKTKQETYFNAEEAIEFGIADEITKELI